MFGGEVLQRDQRVNPAGLSVVSGGGRCWAQLRRQQERGVVGAGVAVAAGFFDGEEAIGVGDHRVDLVQGDQLGCAPTEGPIQQTPATVSGLANRECGSPAGAVLVRADDRGGEVAGEFGGLAQRPPRSIVDRQVSGVAGLGQSTEGSGGGFRSGIPCSDRGVELAPQRANVVAGVAGPAVGQGGGLGKEFASLRGGVRVCGDGAQIVEPDVIAAERGLRCGRGGIGGRNRCGGGHCRLRNKKGLPRAVETVRPWNVPGRRGFGECGQYP